MPEQTLREYVWTRTEKLLPKARIETRDEIRRLICDYAEWLPRSRSARYEEPELTIGYKNRARKLYSQFLKEKTDDMGIGIHRGRGANPHTAWKRNDRRR